MGYFRRYKLTDYTADECRAKMSRRETWLNTNTRLDHDDVVTLMEEWACYRELLARHEKENQSPSDHRTPTPVVKRMRVSDLLKLTCSECGGWGAPTGCRSCGITCMGG